MAAQGFEINNIADLWEENKDWLLIPLVLTIVLFLIGVALLLFFGNSVGMIIRLFGVLLLIGMPILGYYTAEQYHFSLDTYFEPVCHQLDKLFKRA